MAKGIRIGIATFKEMVESGGPFVDKTMLIKDVLDTDSKSFLFLRPRRFGKSINLDMLDQFFNIANRPKDGEMDLFDGLKIETDPDCAACREHRNAHPVIRFEMSALLASSIECFIGSLRNIVAEASSGFRYLFGSDVLSDTDKEMFRLYESRRSDDAALYSFPAFMSKILHEHHGVRPIILMDEYDGFIATVPDTATYNAVIPPYRKFMESCFKSNAHTEFGFATGVLRVAKSGLGSGFNNADVYDVFKDRFGEHCGFTGDEVRRLLEASGADDIESKMRDVKRWYDGYSFGGAEVYNPKSIMAYIRNGYRAADYWDDDGGAGVLSDLYPSQSPESKGVVAAVLREDGPVECVLPRALDFRDIRGEGDGSAFVSLLIGYGYLKARTTEDMGDGLVGCEVSVPNLELRNALGDLKRKCESHRGRLPSTLMSRIAALDSEGATKAMEDLLWGHSFTDGWDHDRYKQNVCDILRMGGFDAVAERELGDGRADIFVDSSPSRKTPRAVIEVKTTSDPGVSLEALCDQALKQIDGRGYGRDPRGRPALHVAMAFRGKSCRVAVLDPEEARQGDASHQPLYPCNPSLAS